MDKKDGKKEITSPRASHIKVTDAEPIKVAVNLEEREFLIDVLKEKLNSSGWSHSIDTLSDELLSRKDIAHLSLENMAEVLLPIVRKLVPKSVKHDFMKSIGNFFKEKEKGLVNENNEDNNDL